MAHSTLLPVVQMCVYCYCRSICSTFTTADPSAVSLFSQNRITEIRTNNWVTLKCSRIRILNSSEWTGWVVCRSVSLQLVRHSINQGTTDTNSTGREGERVGKGVGRNWGDYQQMPGACILHLFCNVAHLIKWLPARAKPSAFVVCRPLAVVCVLATLPWSVSEVGAGRPLAMVYLLLSTKLTNIKGGIMR